MWDFYTVEHSCGHRYRWPGNRPIPEKCIICGEENVPVDPERLEWLKYMVERGKFSDYPDKIDPRSLAAENG